MCEKGVLSIFWLFLTRRWLRNKLGYSLEGGWARSPSRNGIVSKESAKDEFLYPPGNAQRTKVLAVHCRTRSFDGKKRKEREVHTRDNKSPATSDLEGNSWSGMSSIRIRARQARSTVFDIWRACSARSVNEHASRCLLLGKFSRQMPERFRRSRTRYENNERIYVGEVRQKEKERGREGGGGREPERALQTNGRIFTPVVVTSLLPAFYRRLDNPK